MKGYLPPLATLSVILCASPVTADDLLTVGDAAPPLDIAHWFKGEPVNSFEPGRVYVLEFWATWCGPCIGNMEHLSKTQDAYRDRGVSVIGLSDEPLPLTVQFLLMRYGRDKTLQNDRTRYILATDPDRSVYRSYFEAAGLSGIPAVFIIGKDARIEWIGHPVEMDDALEAVVENRWDRAAHQAEILERQEASREFRTASKRISATFEAKQWEDAIEALDVLIALGHETYIPTKYAVLLSRLRDYDRGYAYGREIMEQSWDDNPWLLYQLAWNTAGNDKYPIDDAARDLDFALKVAERSVELTEGSDEMYLTMLARVHAARGEHDQAVKAQRQAIKIVEGDREKVEEHNLERYKLHLARMRERLQEYAAVQQR